VQDAARKPSSAFRSPLWPDVLLLLGHFEAPKSDTTVLSRPSSCTTSAARAAPPEAMTESALAHRSDVSAKLTAALLSGSA
jgi:hypothetical protein